MRAVRVGLPLAAACTIMGCGADGDEITVYLRARLGPDGPPGQRAPVLAPVERTTREGMSNLRQAALEVLVGPSPEERARGFLDSIPLETRLLRVRAGARGVVAELVGRAADDADAPPMPR